MCIDTLKYKYVLNDNECHGINNRQKNKKDQDLLAKQIDF